MPCAAGDLCQLPNEELIAPNGHECGHECRGGCGGRLHGLCGEVEDGSDTPTHRICHTCISKRSPSNSAKRKEGQGFLQPDARKKKKTQESGSRKRLSFEEKLEIIKLLDSMVARPEVARRFGCGITAIASCTGAVLLYYCMGGMVHQCRGDMTHKTSMCEELLLFTTYCGLYPI